MAEENVEIVQMAAEDYAQVASLWRSTEGIGLHDDTNSREGITVYLVRNPGLSFAARQEGRIVGAALCGHDGRRGYLHHLAVDSMYRRRGIGRALVKACLEKLGSVGICKCNIFLFAHNKAAEDFWKQIGWNERPDLKVLQKATAAEML